MLLGTVIVPDVPNGTHIFPFEEEFVSVVRFAGGCSVLRFLFFEQIVVNSHNV